MNEEIFYTIIYGFRDNFPNTKMSHHLPKCIIYVYKRLQNLALFKYTSMKKSKLYNLCKTSILILFNIMFLILGDFSAISTLSPEVSI